MFLKIVTKWQEIQKSKLNNSLTNWVFEKWFSHSILSQCAFLALFICFAISWNFNFAVKLVMSFSRQKLLKPQNKKQDVLEYKVLPSYMYKVWAQMNKKCKSSSWVAAFLVLWAHHATQCACLELRFCFASMWFLYRLFIAVSSIFLSKDHFHIWSCNSDSIKTEDCSLDTNLSC